jgi:hypothetical protein
MNENESLPLGSQQALTAKDLVLKVIYVIIILVPVELQPNADRAAR